jgi:HK97 gp10 family phage protein
MSMMKRMLADGLGRTRKRYDLRDAAASLYDSGASRSEIRAAIADLVVRGKRGGSGAGAGIGGGNDPLVNLVLTGDKELDAMFAAMNNTMQKKALRPATRTVAKMVLEQARAEVPEDTGLLRSELRIKAKARSKRYPHTVGVTVGFRDDLFQGDTFYAGFMEFGTEPRYHKVRAYADSVRARYTGKIDSTRFAFLRPALWSYPERKQAVFRQALTAWLTSHRGTPPRNDALSKLGRWLRGA